MYKEKAPHGGTHVELFCDLSREGFHLDRFLQLTEIFKPIIIKWIGNFSKLSTTKGVRL